MTTDTYSDGLRSFMIRVYNLMFLSVITSGIVAYLIGHNAKLMAGIFSNWVSIIGVILAPFIVMFIIFFGLRTRSAFANGVWLTIFAATLGITLSAIVAHYTNTSIAKVFFISAATFGSASLYGYTTKTDLTEFGNIMIMALFGLVIAGIVNAIYHSPMMDYILSFIGVFVFVGLTAYDTQETKNFYSEATDVEDMNRFAVIAALNLYLDFTNIFVDLIRLFGDVVASDTASDIVSSAADTIGDVISSAIDD